MIACFSHSENLFLTSLQKFQHSYKQKFMKSENSISRGRKSFPGSFPLGKSMLWGGSMLQQMVLGTYTNDRKNVKLSIVFALIELACKYV